MKIKVYDKFAKTTKIYNVVSKAEYSGNKGYVVETDELAYSGSGLKHITKTDDAYIIEEIYD